MCVGESIVGLAILPQLKVDLAELDPIVRHVLFSMHQLEECDLGASQVTRRDGRLILGICLGCARTEQAAAAEQRRNCGESNESQREKEGSVLHDLYILLNIRRL